MKGWDRRLWGIDKVGLGLLGDVWHMTHRDHYDDEPSRPLLFTTRRAARAWCQKKMALYAGYPDGHVCRAWHFRPVRVRERITVAR